MPLHERINPLLEPGKINQNLVRNDAELLYQPEHVLSLHLVPVELPKDVVELLLRDEAVSIWIYFSERHSKLLQSVFLEHHSEEFAFCERDSLLNLGLADAVPVEVTNIAAKVHLELLVLVLQLHLVVQVALLELLRDVDERLDVDDAGVADVEDAVDLGRDLNLLVSELETELFEAPREVTHPDEALFALDTLSFEQLHEFWPVLGLL